jgi:hypothetical protein
MPTFHMVPPVEEGHKADERVGQPEHLLLRHPNLVDGLPTNSQHMGFERWAEQQFSTRVHARSNLR